MIEHLTPYFKRHEFACPCGCGFDAVDAELLLALHKIRDYVGRPIVITKKGGACRCREYNTQIKGSPNSKHLHGKAADIHCPKLTSDVLYAIVDDLFPAKFGVGIYDWHVHIDVRVKRTRWNEKTTRT